MPIAEYDCFLSNDIIRSLDRWQKEKGKSEEDTVLFENLHMMIPFRKLASGVFESQLRKGRKYGVAFAERNK